MSGSELKEILYKAHISQTEMAKRLGITQQAFNATLQSKDIKTSTLEKVAEVMGVSVASLYGNVDIKVVNNVSRPTIKDVNNSNIVQGDGKIESADAVNRLIDELTATRKQNDKLIELLERQMTKDDER